MTNAEGAVKSHEAKQKTKKKGGKNAKNEIIFSQQQQKIHKHNKKAQIICNTLIKEHIAMTTIAITTTQQKSTVKARAQHLHDCTQHRGQTNRGQHNGPTKCAHLPQKQ